MDHPLLVAAVDGLADLKQHLQDYRLVQCAVLPVPIDPLPKVAPLTVLHYDEQLSCLRHRDGVHDLHDAISVDLCLNLDLATDEGMRCIQGLAMDPFSVGVKSEH